LFLSNSTTKQLFLLHFHNVYVQAAPYNRQKQALEVNQQFVTYQETDGSYCLHFSPQSKCCGQPNLWACACNRKWSTKFTTV